jgi:HK97 gp10 family phage protein
MADTAVQGLAEALEKLKLFPDRLARNVMRGALRAAAKPVVEDARRRVPVLAVPDARRRAGALKRSIRSMSPQLRLNEGLIKGGVRAGANKKKDDPFYAHMVERGTVKMGARPFLRPAGDTQAGAAGDALAAYVLARFEAEALK